MGQSRRQQWAVELDNAVSALERSEQVLSAAFLSLDVDAVRKARLEWEDCLHRCRSIIRMFAEDTELEDMDAPQELKRLAFSRAAVSPESKPRPNPRDRMVGNLVGMLLLVFIALFLLIAAAKNSALR